MRATSDWLHPSAAGQDRALTQTGLYDFYGAVVVLDGLAVLIHVTQCGGDMIVGLSQQATVGRQVLQLQGKTLLEVFKCLGIVTWGNTMGNSYLCGTFVTGVN